jgi:hypothetical protein
MEGQISMKNAHERFGWLELDKPLNDTRNRIRVALDRFIGENSEDKEVSGVVHVIRSSEATSISAPSGRRSRDRNH